MKILYFKLEIVIRKNKKVAIFLLHFQKKIKPLVIFSIQNNRKLFRHVSINYVVNNKKLYIYLYLHFLNHIYVLFTIILRFINIPFY